MRIKFGYSVLACSAAMMLFILIGTRDARLAENAPFNRGVEPAPTDQNGYDLLDFGNLNAGRCDQEMVDRRLLLAHVGGAIWHKKYVTLIVSDCMPQIESLGLSVKSEYFQLERPDEYLGLPNYIPVIQMSRLTLLAAMNAEEEGDLGLAIQYLEWALKYADKVRNERNHFLISYLIGLVIQDQALMRIQHLVSLKSLSAEELKQIQLMLEMITPYSDSEFSRVLAGEYHFTEETMDYIYSDGIGGRWSQYRNDEDSLAFTEYLGTDSPLPTEVLRILLVAFPDFYLHKNETLNNMAEGLRVQLQSAEGGCHFKAYPASLGSDVKWADVFTPNSRGVRDPDDAPDYSEYFVRRCLSLTNLEAVKSIVALRRYHLDQGGYPGMLSELVPDYLNRLPVDYFSQEPLRYSEQHEWLYSVGADFIDQGGGVDSIYQHRCHFDSCAENPTFPFGVLPLKTHAYHLKASEQ